ncbi:hypothetical protein EVAR_95972_1 [Eumeta japonica]|uniref:Uncharacterized protein n=1 Tax=Eumeta variegata TaxID=151549 RepID=A0A4C1V9A4_EUMVA|nr:hypothetical protein EVAR_95972_1 [Eumeta japonica]
MELRSFITEFLCPPFSSIITSPPCHHNTALLRDILYNFAAKPDTGAICSSSVTNGDARPLYERPTSSLHSRIKITPQKSRFATLFRPYFMKAVVREALIERDGRGVKGNDCIPRDVRGGQGSCERNNPLYLSVCLFEISLERLNRSQCDCHWKELWLVPESELKAERRAESRTGPGSKLKAGSGH